MAPELSVTQPAPARSHFRRRRPQRIGRVFKMSFHREARSAGQNGPWRSGWIDSSRRCAAPRNDILEARPDRDSFGRKVAGDRLSPASGLPTLSTEWFCRSPMTSAPYYMNSAYPETASAKGRRPADPEEIRGVRPGPAWTPPGPSRPALFARKNHRTVHPRRAPTRSGGGLVPRSPRSGRAKGTRRTTG